MNAAEFARHFTRVKRRGTWHDARCPAHDDRRPSLSFKDGDRGLIVKCHAGCALERVVAALGLRMRDLFNNNTSASRRIEATYAYHDEEGQLLYEVVRFEPKSFAMRRPDANGGWIWDIRGIRRVLYRLPALKGCEVVFVVEGEKDADALAALGLAATTCPWGAGSWRDEYAEQLRAAGAAHVIVIPDNDDAGHALAGTVEQSCGRMGLMASVINLPGLQPKGDVSDWFAAGHGRDDLLNLIGPVDGVAR
jgi:putative DNA primase/helicase